jgi:hypothetical protein
VLETTSALKGLTATTFDDDGHAVGTSSFAVETEDAGLRHLTVKMAIDGGGQSVSEATLAPIEAALLGHPGPGHTIRPIGPGHSYRLLEERSQATRADGVSLEYLVIDHERGRVTCYPPDRDLTKGSHLDLPEDERVVNVPLQLLFQPLVHGEVQRVRFQIATCRDGPAIHDIVAVRGPTTQHEGRPVVEIRYGPDLGNAMSWLASRLLPRFSFWFDARDGSYLGHRMPLYRKGPEIVLVRQGLTPLDLGAE